MADITIRDMPDRLYRRLEGRAKEQRRTVDREVIARLESSIERNPIDVEEWIAEAERNARNIRGFLTDEMLKAFKEEGRE